MTIPALNGAIQDRENKSAWKKIYSTFSNAAISIRQDNGGEMAGALTHANTERDVFLTYISAIKKCDYTLALGKCWHAAGVIKYLNGQQDSNIEIDDIWNFAHSSGAILKDGAFVLFSDVVSTCDQGSFLVCSNITVDVNGVKAPNVVGRDIFRMVVRNNDIKPYGFSHNASWLNYFCNASIVGADQEGNYYCSTKYLME